MHCYMCAVCGSFRGLWENGVRDGLGEEVAEDGSTLVCTWQSGKTHGKGTLTLIDGTVMNVHYDRGRLLSCHTQKRK
jgi:MORN repeat